MSMYGKLNNHLHRTNFQLYKVYPNRRAMVREVEEVTAEDPDDEIYVPYYSYLLVDYSNGTNSYIENAQIDQNEYGTNNFDLTVWQVQGIPMGEGQVPRCIAIARLHSILPTFDKSGEYRVDILAPISGGDYFGKGKNIYTLNENNIPVGRQE